MSLWVNTPSDFLRMRVCHDRQLMFALFSSIRRSHNTTGDGVKEKEKKQNKDYGVTV